MHLHMPVHHGVQYAPSSAGVSVISMAYLDPADGWVSLRSYSGDWELLEQLAETSVAALHECLDSSAVHGDLSADNVFIRYNFPSCIITTTAAGQPTMYASLSCGLLGFRVYRHTGARSGGAIQKGVRTRCL